MSSRTESGSEGCSRAANGPKQGAISIAQWGTFDLANFGDLLFPLIFEREIKKRLGDAVVSLRSPIGGPFQPDPRRTVKRIVRFEDPLFYDQILGVDAIVLGGGDIIRFDDWALAGLYGSSADEAIRLRFMRVFLYDLGLLAQVLLDRAAFAYSKMNRLARTSLLLSLALSLGVFPSPRRGFASKSETAATPIDTERGAAALDQALRDLSNPFTVMSVAAHPGGEDTGTLAYCRKKLGARTVSVFATRGEGGDSATGSEFDDELGLTKTREALEASELTGSDAYFLNLPDFGFSKSIEETLAVWGREEALRRLVKALRSIRPDIIIIGQENTALGAHGQALFRLVVEAYDAAAENGRFPETGLDAWQTRRLFQQTDESAAGVTINLAEYDRVRGKTYAELGLMALRRYGTLGPRAELAPDSTSRRYYKLVRPSVETLEHGGSLFTGLSLSERLSRELAPPRVGDLSASEAIGQTDALIGSLANALILKQAQGPASELRERYGGDSLRLIRYIQSLERAIRFALGVEFDVKVSRRLLVPGQKFAVTLAVRNGSGRQLPVAFQVPRSIEQGKPDQYKQSEVKVLSPSVALSEVYEYQLPENAAVTVPYAKDSEENDYYPAGSFAPLEPFGRRVVFFAEVEIERTTITIPATVTLAVAPKFEVVVAPKFALVKDWSTSRGMNFKARLINHTSEALDGALWIVSRAMISDDYEPESVSLPANGGEVELDFKLSLPLLKPPLAPDVLIELRRRGSDSINALASTKIRIIESGVDAPGDLTVGYVRGADDSLGLALTQLGAAHSELEADYIRSGDLSRFDCILIDRFAYHFRPDLTKYNKRLLEYAKRGGALVVFSQNPTDWKAGLLRPPLAPFPLTLSDKRITVESAPVKIVSPDHPLMSKPNRITARDFDGWVRERADYLPVEWATEYTPLLESSDPGEPSLKGGLLVARYGKGYYVYTSYSWNRQLHAINLGAYRMLANLVSLAKGN